MVGSGPNGLAAAIRMAQAGCSVLVLEGKDSIGGGLRSAEVTLSGFVHDIYAAVLSMGDASPYLRTLPLADIPPARAVLCDVTPRQLLSIAGDRLPAGYRRQLARFRYGHAAFKVDYALAGPMPWRNPDCRRAGTLHLGSTLAEMAAAERVVWQGRPSEQPYVLAVQASVFDTTRAPAGQHTLWTYCHVLRGSTVDMTARIDAQIERFAPGFRDLVLARSVRSAPEMELYNPNYIGGDINGGVQDLRQQWTRPVVRWNPYTTPVKGLYICSSSTPPGGGVHGMCGYHAAQAALRELGGG